jgi:hypothetical protein
MTVKEKLAEYGGFVDVGILQHGFAPHMRDYDVHFEALWGKVKWGDQKGTYLLRFSHCPEATTTTRVSDESWKHSWADLFIDSAKWEAAGEPEGFLWGTCWSLAYPGLSYVEVSERAKHWSERLGKLMHEVAIETEAFRVHIIFHDFSVTKLSDEVQVVDKVISPLNENKDKAG